MKKTNKAIFIAFFFISSYLFDKFHELIYIYHKKALANHDLLENISNEMAFLTNRDKTLSQNIANSDTPNYIPHDIIHKKQDSDINIDLYKTHIAHFELHENSRSQFQEITGKIIEIKPNGNMVNLQNEIQEKDDNALKYAQMTGLYNAVKGLYRTSMRTK